LRELDTLLALATRLGFVSQELMRQRLAETDEIGRMSRRCAQSGARA
jgi:hypothetical protein